MKEIPNEEEWANDLEKMSLMRNGVRQIPFGVSPSCSKLTTLLLNNNPLEFIQDSFFLKMCCLYILDLSGTHIQKLPNSISDMEKLEGLLLGKCTRLVSIPNLGKLKQLRDLDVSDTAICEIPRGMENTINLRSLWLQATTSMKILPRGFLLNFPHLECLHLPDHIQAPVEELDRLNNLEEFCGVVKDESEFNILARSRPNWSYSIVVLSNGLLYDNISFLNVNKDVITTHNGST